MEAYLSEWLSLLVRWFHVIAGVAWIGASFYFIWLDNHLREPPEWKKPYSQKAGSSKNVLESLSRRVDNYQWEHPPNRSRGQGKPLKVLDKATFECIMRWCPTGGWQVDDIMSQKHVGVPGEELRRLLEAAGQR